MNLSLTQVLLIVCDIALEAVWPLSLMITVNPVTGGYDYDPYVMQACASFFSFLISMTIDWYKLGYRIPSLFIGWKRLIHAFIAVSFFCSGVISLTTGFKSASSGAAATIGFLSLPIFIMIELSASTFWYDIKELSSIRKKLGGITPEILLIITTCAALFSLEDSGSSVEGILFLLLGRVLICIKSYINGRQGELEENDCTISNASAFLAMNAFLKYCLSQPAALLLDGKNDWSDLIPFKAWNWLTIIAFMGDSFTCVSNILVEMNVSGEMQAITGMSGRILGMYIAFMYDVTPTSPIIISVVSISLAVIAYMRLHYRFGAYDPKTMLYMNMSKKLNENAVLFFWQTY